MRSNRMAPATELVMNEPNKKFLELRSNSRGHGGMSFKTSLQLYLSPRITLPPNKKDRDGCLCPGMGVISAAAAS